jgi:hypothetical protein
MTDAPSEDRPTSRKELVVPATQALTRLTDIKTATLTGAMVADAGEELVLEVEIPVGECPACGFQCRGVVAWSSVHMEVFACNNSECNVQRFEDTHLAEREEP